MKNPSVKTRCYQKPVFDIIGVFRSCNIMLAVNKKKILTLFLTYKHARM